MKQITEFVKAASDIIEYVSPGDDKPFAAMLDELRACVATAKQFQATPALIDAARGQYATDDIEVDDDATTSPGDDGTWVSAWVWVAS